MTTHAWVQAIALVLHILSVVAVLSLLLHQIKKSPRIIHPGVLHSGATALLAGLVMVGIRTPLTIENPDKWPELNNAWVAIKFTILIAVLVLGYRNAKKSEVKNSVWLAMIGLVTTNLLIAIFW